MSLKRDGNFAAMDYQMKLLFFVQTIPSPAVTVCLNALPHTKVGILFPEISVMIVNVYTAPTATAARTFSPRLPLTAHGHCPAKYDILDMARQ